MRKADDMARVTDLTFSMTPGIGNETVKISYNVLFSTFDVTSKLPYVEQVILRGDDTLPGETGPDDVVNLISTTTLIPSGNPGVPVPRTHSKTLALSALNEDQKPGDTNPNPDEFRALVVLTPVLPTRVEVESTNAVTRAIA